MNEIHAHPSVLLLMRRLFTKDNNDRKKRVKRRFKSDEIRKYIHVCTHLQFIFMRSGVIDALLDSAHPSQPDKLLRSIPNFPNF